MEFSESNQDLEFLPAAPRTTMSKVLNQGSSSCCSICSSWWSCEWPEQHDSWALTFDISPNTEAMILIILSSFWLQRHIKSNKKVLVSGVTQAAPSTTTVRVNVNFCCFSVVKAGPRLHWHQTADKNSNDYVWTLYERICHVRNVLGEIFRNFSLSFTDFLTFTQLFWVFSTSRNYIKK